MTIGSNFDTAASRCELVTVPLKTVVTIDEAGLAKSTTTPSQKCGEPASTVDLINGFRCEAHPPRWEPGYAQYLRNMGWGQTADAYRRVMIATLTDRILTRYQEAEAA